MAGIAISRFHIPISEFYELTPGEFKKAVDDNDKLEVQKQKIHYSIARYIVTNIWNSAGKSLKRSITNPVKELPFEWELKETPIRQQSLQEMKEALYSIAKAFKSKKK